MLVIQVNVLFILKWSIFENNCIKLFFDKLNIRIICDKVFVLDFENLK